MDTPESLGTMFTWQEAAEETPIPLIRSASFQVKRGVYSLGEENPADEQEVDIRNLSIINKILTCYGQH
jgi:hypothetical protein